MEMCATKQTLFLFATLLATWSARAGEIALTVPPQIALDTQQSGNSAADKTSAADRELASDPASINDTQTLRPAPARKLAEPAGGLHWATDGQRPVLQYRFSDDALMRLRGSAGGAAISFSLKF
jgi:hypothetical protein